MKHIVIIGATSSIAHECAKLWLKESPKYLTLVVRDINKAQRVLDDLKVRSPHSNIKIIASDFINPDNIENTVSDVLKRGLIDIALIAHGSLPDQSDCQHNLSLCKETLEVNGISPALFAESLAEEMEKAKQGIIAIIGSVAGDRGRKSNYVYGSAKGMVNRYTQGLQHRFAGSPIKVILIKPGPTDTPMTSFLKQKGAHMATAQDVAKNIVKGIAFGNKVIYTPKKWQIIMLVIQHIPGVLFNRINI